MLYRGAFESHVEENFYLIWIYQDYFHPLIAERPDFQAMQKSFLRDNAFLTGYIYTQESGSDSKSAAGNS